MDGDAQVGTKFVIAVGKCARWLNERPTIIFLSRLLPYRIRDWLRVNAHRVREAGGFYELPVRIQLPRVAGEVRAQRRVIIYGNFYFHWNVAFADPMLWKTILGVTEVVRVPSALKIKEIGSLPEDDRTVIIPLAEEHIRDCPRDYLSLIPDSRSICILSSKALFALFLEELGLSKLHPRIYKSTDEAEFPCVLKRLDTHGTVGVSLVSSSQHLQSLLRNDVFRGQDYLLQSFVSGATEYVTHCVCKDGEILWDCSFARDLGRLPCIGGMAFDNLTKITVSHRTRAQIASVLAPLRYSGPCCIDYKLFENGDVALFEINPRFGGSLMISANRDLLRQALTCILNNAR